MMIYSNNNGDSRYTVNSQNALDLWTNLICNPRNERADRELVQLSNDERTRVFADLGGAQDINPEDPDFITRCLLELNLALNDFEPKQAFRQAQQMCPHYTNNPGFRIMFLRADEFNIQRTAQRIVAHFEEKKTLFGEDKIARDITLADLDTDDLECLEAGGLQVLSNPDRFGRVIFCSRQVNWVYRERENLRRTLWYVLTSILEAEDAQRRGIVALGYSVGDFHRGTVDYEMHRQFMKTAATIPIRVSAVYMCYSNARFEKVANVVVHFFNSFLRVRFRVIKGTRQECNYQLMLMGIPYASIPVSDDGELLRDNHLQWLQYRRQLETSRAEAILRAFQESANPDQLLQIISSLRSH